MRKPAGYWNKEKCQEIALKYKYKKDFIKNDINAYNAAHRLKYLDDICDHMIEIGNLKRRCIYSFEFDDNSVYVGLTLNINERKTDHLCREKSSVFKYLDKNKNNFIFKQLTDYLPINEAKDMEGKYVNQYKEKGWKILNKVKTGGVGGNTLYWTYKKCKEEALKYKNKSSFNKKSRGAYSSASKNKWLNDICSHMIELQKPKGYWTFDKCQECASKVNNKKDFKLKSPTAYDVSRKNKWLNNICSHMIELQKPKGYWTFDICRNEALKYNSKTEFLKNSSAAYDFASRQKWINNICSHMIHHNGKVLWTYEKCKEEALKYDYKTDFNKFSHVVYNISYRHGWLNEICSHMTKKLNRTKSSIYVKYHRTKN